MPATRESVLVRKRKKRKARRRPLFPVLLLLLMAAAGIWGVRKFTRLRRGVTPREEPRVVAFVGSDTNLRQEYQRYYGQRLSNADLIARFQRAGQLAAGRNFTEATATLESISKEAELPLVYTNLGILYAAIGDVPRAITGFRNVFARDFDYAPARNFLKDSRQIGPGATDPLRAEVEPNGERAQANQIALESAVTGDVGSVSGDVDYFRVAAPQSPRDLITIELLNNSKTFTPRVHVSDAAWHTLEWGERIARQGESLKVSGAPAPNSTFYVAVSAFESAGGSYVLRVTADKAFDRYEPNDNILDAAHIALGEEIPANIMDSIDTDYYSFVSPRKGEVTLEIRNRSASLVPTFTVYDASRRVQLIAPDNRKPGGSFRETFKVERDLVYFVQVSSQIGTAGAYTLRVD
jgi:hypothetical protein